MLLYMVLYVCVYAQLCQTLCDPMDCSPPGSSVHVILQARMLEWVAMPSSRVSSQRWDWTCVSWIAGRFFTSWVTKEYMEYMVLYKYILKRSPGLDKKLNLNPTLFLASFVTFSKLPIIDIVS